jgi:magnesium chelatase family protein
MMRKRCVRVRLLSLPKIRNGISGSLLDRIDIHIAVPRENYEQLSADQVGKSLKSICQRVQAARDIQRKQFSRNDSADIVSNADMRVGEIRQLCKLQDEGRCFMARRKDCRIKEQQASLIGIAE